MGIVHTLSDRAWLRGPFSRVAAGYIRLVFRTGDWRIIGEATPARFWDADKPFIGAFWHGRLLMMPCCWRQGKAIRVLISLRGEGPLIAAVISHFDLGAVYGSSTQGGTRALRALARASAEGNSVAVTPDGPLGPRMRVARGIISLARMTGLPILPVSYSARRAAVLKSWDSLLVPYPGSGGAIIWGEPVSVDPDADADALEAARIALETQMIALTNEADRLCGRNTVPPAAAVAEWAIAPDPDPEPSPPA